jgi:acetyl esterase/lipase
MILCYAVITFGEHRHNGSMVNLLGNDPPEDLRLLLSAEKQVTADTPPTFLWHTADDPGVLVENSLLFAQALRRHKVPFELHIFPTGRHGLGLAPDNPHVATWTRLCECWLRSQGFMNQPCIAGGP